MVATNYLWMASYLHEMLGSYVEEAPSTGTGSHLYEETLLAAHIVELGIQSFDSGFSEFVQEHPDAKASSLYQVVQRFPNEAVRNGAALMIERLTTAAPGSGFMPLTTGVSGQPRIEVGADGLFIRSRIKTGAYENLAYTGVKRPLAHLPVVELQDIDAIRQARPEMRHEVRPEMRLQIHECGCKEVRPGVWAAQGHGGLLRHVEMEADRDRQAEAGRYGADCE